MRRTALLVASLALLAAAGCGSAGKAPTVLLSEKLQPIAGGTVDTTHTSVVGIGIVPGGNFQQMEMCSGTLIAPNLVLTARHCVAPAPSGGVICGSSSFGTPYAANDLYITTATQISYGANFTQGQEVRVPSQGNDVCGYDVALIILKSPITGVTPYVPRIDKPVTLGEVYTAVGYGETSTTNQQSAGERRERTNLHVAWYNNQSDPSLCGSSSPCGYGVASSEWQGETGICSGDSGGPALDSNGMEIGVVSRGASCQYPVYGAVSTWKEFIIQGALDAAKIGGYTPPKWATTGSTSGLGGAGGAGGAAAGGAGGTGGQAAGGAGGATGVGGTGGAAGAAGAATSGDPQGTACSASNRCPSGYECVYDSDPSHAYCAKVCDANNTCSSGLECASVSKSIQVCKSAPKAAADTNSSSGCSLGEGRGPAKPVPWFVGLSLVGLALMRRRRS